MLKPMQEVGCLIGNAVAAPKVYMGKKDIRNGIESGNWRPHLWTFQKLRRFMRHVCKHAWNESSTILGAQAGSNAIAGFLADAKDREAAAMMKRMGVKTIGDVERDAQRTVRG